MASKPGLSQRDTGWVLRHNAKGPPAEDGIAGRAFAVGPKLWG